MRILVVLVATTFALASLLGEEPLDGRVSETRSITRMVARLQADAERRLNEEGPMPDLAEIIGRGRSVEELSRAAIVFHGYASPQSAEYVRYDEVFEEAQWACIREIAGRPGKEAELMLVYLKPILGRDAGPSLLFLDLMKRQKDITKAAQPGATDNPDDSQRLREDH